MAVRFKHESVRRRLVEVAVEIEVGALLAHEQRRRRSPGRPPDRRGFDHEALRHRGAGRAASSLLDVTGVMARPAHGSPGRAVDGWIEHMYRHAQVMQRHPLGEQRDPANIVAERGLGLPKGR